MAEIIPRYEFRVFAPDLKWFGEKLTANATFDRYRESRELYLVSAHTENFNVKLRDDKLDIKERVETVNGLERWKPVLKAEFPVDKKVLQDKMLPFLGMEIKEPDTENMSLQKCIRFLQETDPHIAPVHIIKKRYGYRVDDAMLELADVYVNGGHIMTVSAESENDQTVHRLRDRLGLGAEENVNYVVAIKRILGWLPLPASSVYNVLSRR